MSTPLRNKPLAELRRRLPELMLRDQRRLQRRIDGAGKTRDAEKQQRIIEQISAEVAAAEERVERRRTQLPPVTYPAALPVSQRKDDILAAIRDHQVVIVAGETGSGKTTQIPKICLELGRGIKGTVGHTQPRRLAARTVAERIAEELKTELGAAIGYKVRFTDHASDATVVKLMTDGILLAEIQQDRLLRQYDTLIIDEAHERSLNIDFILGYLKQLLPRRPDLKVIITSATIDPGRFSRHFDDAPIVEVSGRTYPVEVRYRPINDPDLPDAEERDQVQAICDAVGELSVESPDDILVFLSGEREIRDTADALAKLELRHTEIVPLYARLSAGEQHRVFQRHSGRRIVLATNVAETSLTVPGIKYVIDPGTARMSRYSHRLKVQRLPIEAVSQASANQRKGRCGRVSDGICVRLYSEEDFDSRPEFTEPEILRTNLASVILQMTALGLGDIAAFPFVEPPDRRNINDGIQLLQELGALEPKSAADAQSSADTQSGTDARSADKPSSEQRQLTQVGRKLAQLPVDPRLARMVLAADSNGCVREVLVIAAALSIQDPRERPTEHQQSAGEKHARFADKDSDFVAFLNLWNYLRDKQRELSSNQFRKLCRAEFLNYLRVREWQDVYLQLRQVAKTLGMSLDSEDAEPQRIHMALLAGLLSHVGLKEADKKEYLGARNARFSIFPGSALFKKPPRWVMAAELVETSRLWGRIAARVEPEWIEPLAEHVVKRTYSEPHWEKRRGSVVANEKVTLYGLPIVVARKVNYGRIDPELSRELFIRNALVEGDWDTRHAFFHHNRKLLKEIEDLEHRARRRNILVDDETLFELYDERVGQDVVSARHFDSWWKKTRREQPDLLTFTRELLVNQTSDTLRDSDFPNSWVQGDVQLPLTYQFEPGRSTDGVTTHVPLAVLNQVDADGFAWHIPGLREELVTALLRSLPKPLRRNFVPVPDYAKAVVARLDPGDGSLLDALEREIRALSGITIPPDAWQLEQIPAHLRTTFRVVDDSKRVLAEGKDLASLKDQLSPKVRETLSDAGGAIERRGLRGWDFDTLPRSFEQRKGDHAVRGYPALVDDGDTVAIRIFETEAQQEKSMWSGTRRLLLTQLPSPAKYVLGKLSNRAKLTLNLNPHGSVTALLADCTACAADKIITDSGGPAWDRVSFDAMLSRARSALNPTVLGVLAAVEKVLAAAHEADARLTRTISTPELAPSLADIRTQLSTLVYPSFVADTGWRQLPELVRYLRAVERRIEKLPENPRRDQDSMERVHQIQREYQQLRDQPPAGGVASSTLTQVRWMIEELRVSYFAQLLGTPYPVSDKRIYKVIDQLTG